jgi:shikimate dehydrogenase
MKLDRYAVLGNPVAHSQSPFIHARFAEQTGEAIEYGRVLCPFDGFERTVRAFAAEGGRGVNVTVPFKFEAPRLAARVSRRAALAQAANVLCFDDDGWLADNTDGIGLIDDIERNAGLRLGGTRVLLVGAGGAAAGVLGPLLDAGPAEVVVANRSLDKADALVARHRPVAGPARLSATNLADAGEGFDIVINSSSSSLASADIPVHGRVLRPGTLAIDLMYGPPAQGFLQWAERHGAHGRDGLGMLVEQAAQAFFLWRGRRPDTAPVLTALRGHLQERAR